MQNSNQLQLRALIQQLDLLRSEMLSLEATSLAGSAGVHSDHRASAANLIHYLALRRHDIRQLQSQLAALGLSSLGRTESHVLGALHAVMNALLRLDGSDEEGAALPDGAPEMDEGAALLDKNAEALLGPLPKGRNVRIMVTMPPEAATDHDLVRDLVLHGMDCMRINCAHDGPEAWSGMIRNLRRAEKETGRPCKIAMDLAGPKLRTGPVEPGPAVLKFRPKRDDFGRVVSPARIWLTPGSQPEHAPAHADATIPLPLEWLAQRKPGDRIRFRDARGASRSLTISGIDGNSRWAQSNRTAYVASGLVFEVQPRANRRIAKALRRARVGAIPPKAQTLRLNVGDTLVLTRSLEPGHLAKYDKKKLLISPARIGVTLPEFFDCVRVGEPISLDDGKIGAVVRTVAPEKVTVEITHARPLGEKLGAEKGINVPESELCLSSLTEDDLEALKFVVKHADIVSYSFVRKEKDVHELQARLAELGGENLGIILKIETREAFDQLPRLLLAAMRSRAVGVMIARGDLAIECGYQRLAEVQEEILWLCEAAHMPVIWATQVLESLAKTGVPSRSEITDAAMGERAECVMLNKGPYIVTAVRTLDDILHRMQSHQEKKRSMLRKLHVASAFRAGASA
ncbi:MAG TPA: pyruvate kinase [Candidatus Acidoferrales bacterium]|nr:pyruvate kinase [Candidatus Acidoferrales bacterium]